MQMEMTELEEIVSQYLADAIQGKNAEQIRGFLGLTNDFTPEEEAEIRRQNQEWMLQMAIMR